MFFNVNNQEHSMIVIPATGVDSYPTGKHSTVQLNAGTQLVYIFPE
jgi:hypothetical protein